MKKIDTHTWKEFSMKELGFTNFHGSRLRYVDRKEGDVPFITAGKENQGIIGTIGNEVTTYCDPITIDMFGNVFYHDGLLAGDDNVYFFVNPQIGKYEKMFIVSVIRAQLGTSFAYVDQFRQDDADALTVSLPSKDNQPDFAYMEQYILSFEQRIKTTLTTFEHLIQLPKHTVDTTQWKAYRLGDLYEKIYLTNFQKIDKRHDVSLEKTPEYSLPLVNAKDGNNGIMYYGKDSVFQGIEMTIDIVQNGAVATGNVYAQPQKTGVLWDAYLIKAKQHQDTKYTLLFMAAVIQKMIKSKYGYNNKAIWEKVKDNEILLPTTPNGTPDFAYMEQYMKKIEQRVQQNLNKIA